MSNNPSNQHSPVVRGAARLSVRLAGVPEAFAVRQAELRRRVAARRAGAPEEEGLESIEVVVLSVIGLAVVLLVGGAIKGLVEGQIAKLNVP